MHPSGTHFFRKKLEIPLCQKCLIFSGKEHYFLLQIASLALCRLQLWQFMEGEPRGGLKMGTGKINSWNR